MKIYIIGSIKIDSKHRRRLFLSNLDSLKPISSLISWDFNIVGKYSEFCKSEINKRYNNVTISNDDETPLYNILKRQIANIQHSDPLFFFWQEDHWFVCPHKNLFFYLLDKFQKSEAEILKVTHLVDSWERKHFHKLIINKKLYQEYLITLDSQTELLKNILESYLTTIPGIYKKSITLELLEANKLITSIAKQPGNFELHGQVAEEFLRKKSFIQMTPKFHVLREVCRFNQEKRAINMKDAFRIIRSRDNLQNFSIWTKIINMILKPRITGGKIKRRIFK